MNINISCPLRGKDQSRIFTVFSILEQVCCIYKHTHTHARTRTHTFTHTYVYTHNTHTNGKTGVIGTVEQEM